MFWTKKDLLMSKAKNVVEFARTYAVQTYLEAQNDLAPKGIHLKRWELLFSVAVLNEFLFKYHQKTNYQQSEVAKKFYAKVIEEAVKSGMSEQVIEHCQIYVIDNVQKGQRRDQMIGTWIIVNSKTSLITEEEFDMALRLGTAITFASEKLADDSLAS